MIIERRQFPLQMYYTITMSDLQGQTFSRLQDLREHPFMVYRSQPYLQSGRLSTVYLLLYPCTTRHERNIHSGGTALQTLKGSPLSWGSKHFRTPAMYRKCRYVCMYLYYKMNMPGHASAYGCNGGLMAECNARSIGFIFT